MPGPGQTCEWDGTQVGIFDGPGRCPPPPPLVANPVIEPLPHALNPAELA